MSRTRAVLAGAATLLLSAPLAPSQSTRNVTLAWNAVTNPATAGYHLYQGGASRSYTNVFDAGNHTNATASGLAAGCTYYFAVTDYCTNGLESDYSTEISYTAPVATNPPPTLALTAPANGAVYTAPANITVAASVTTNGHTITQVQFYSGSALLGADAVPPYACSWTNVPAGNYNLSAQVIYDSGSVASSPAISITVATPPAPGPTVALTAPANGAVYTAPANITLAASVTTNGHTITQVQFYSGSALLGADAVPPYACSWTNVPAGNYSLSAQVIYDSGSLTSSPAISITVAAAPSTGTTFAASSGSLSGFVVTNGMIFQTATTGVTNGGRAAYTFTVGTTGDYLVSGLVNASNAAANSFYVNIDAEPTDPTMIWDIPIISGFTNQTVSWRGSGTSTNDQFSPKVFNLAQGTHQLIVRGRAAYAQLASLTILPATVLPNPWQAIDIGNPLLTGNASICGSQYTVGGAGSLSGSADQLRFLYQSMTGNGEIRGRISSFTNASANGLAGVIMRETLNPGSRYAFMGLSGNGTVYWQRRGSTSGSTSYTTSGTVSLNSLKVSPSGNTSYTTSGTGTLPNFWARLVRSGNKFYGYKSTDGTNWTRVTYVSIGMATNIYFGFAVSSGSSNTVATAVFDNATIIP